MGSSIPLRSTLRRFADQEAGIAAYGGLDAIKQRGDFGYTPAPEQAPGSADAAPQRC